MENRSIKSRHGDGSGQRLGIDRDRLREKIRRMKEHSDRHPADGASAAHRRKLEERL